MKTKRSVIVTIVGLSLFTCAARAEFRSWADSKGNTVEAEYIRMTDDMVVMRKLDGSEIKVPLDSLSAEDCKYAMLLNPPKIDITVNDQTEGETVGYKGGNRRGSSIRVEAIKANVSIKKISTGRYDAELSLDVLLIGKTVQLDRYTVLERGRSNFFLTAENKGAYEFSCGPVDIRNVTGSRNSGVEYEGFLVLVSDSRGQIIAKKASRLEFEKNAESMQKASAGAIFDQDFNLVNVAKKSQKK